MTLKEEILFCIRFLEFLSKQIIQQEKAVEIKTSIQKLDEELLITYLKKFEELRLYTVALLEKLFRQKEQVIDLKYRQFHRKLTA